MKRTPSKFGDEIRTLEPESIEEIPVGRNDDGRVLVCNDFNELGRLRKVFVTCILGSKEGHTRRIRDVRILGTFRCELNE